MAMLPPLELHVSPTGSDASTGSVSRPFRTLSHALEASKGNAGNNPVRIVMRGGSYSISKPLEIRQAVSIVAAAGEHPILSGARDFVPHWEPYAGQVLKTAVPKGMDFDQFYVNGKPQILARFPNFEPNARVFHGFAADAIDPHRVKNWANPKGGFVHALHAAEWGGLDFRITGKDPEGGLVMEGGWQNNRPDQMHPAYRFVEGVFEELDSPGEWYLDREKHVLYYWPASGLDLRRASYGGATAEGLFDIQGKPGAPVRNVHLEGLTITQTARTFMKTREPLLRSDWRIYRGGAIHFENAEDCSIRDCTFVHLGGNAVFVDGHARHVDITGSDFSDIGASGICFVGSPKAVRNPLDNYDKRQSLSQISLEPGPQTEDYPRECRVSDCLIQRTGQTEKQSAGVQIAMAFRIHVLHCTISDVPRAGINIGDGCWGGHLIEDCDVFDTVKETGDHGSFNAWGRDRYWGLEGVDAKTAQRSQLPFLDAVEPVILRHNRWRCDHGWDIDLDDGASNYVIEDNLCLNGGLKNREGYRRVVQNNIIVNNSFHPHVWFADCKDVFRRNIVFTPYRSIQVEKPWGAEVDFNLFHQVGAGEGSPAVELQSLSGRDTHSWTGDALFMDSQRGDYRVKRDSPALKLGFHNFAMDSFGVTSVRLRALARLPELPRFEGASVESEASKEQEWLGAKVRTVFGLGEQSALGLPSAKGALLVTVPKRSFASRFGLRQNDVILECDDQPIGSSAELLVRWSSIEQNRRVKLVVYRDQKKLSLEFLKSGRP